VPLVGFEKPSAIQQKGIVPFAKNLDVIQQAQSGTGKTATFCAGILQNLDYNLLDCQALVLAPTRELAQQIEKVMRALGDYQQVHIPLCDLTVLWTNQAWKMRQSGWGVSLVLRRNGRVETGPTNEGSGLPYTD
jgi:translation initiation factor 4A